MADLSVWHGEFILTHFSYSLGNMVWYGCYGNCLPAQVNQILIAIQNRL